MLQMSERRWPAANTTSLWNQFDSDVDQILEATVRGDVDRKLQTMATIIVSIASERFGDEEKKDAKRLHSKNQRDVGIHNIRQEMNRGEEECIGLAQLICTLRKIMVLSRAEWHRRRRHERARKRAAFIANPFKFTKELLGQKRSGTLACIQEIDHHLKQTYSDPVREQHPDRSSGAMCAVRHIRAAAGGSL